MKKKKIKKSFKRIWDFIWEDNSIWSWIVNVILAFVLIKYIVYPGLGFVLATTHPVVAVVSESMEHNSLGFEDWWEKNKDWYISHGIEKGEFMEFSLKNGFNKGDIIILMGKDAEKIETGNVIVFRSNRKDPIIHRIVVKENKDGTYIFKTKGDNNRDFIKNNLLDETNITPEDVIGKAVFRIPYLGYIKIAFVELLEFVKTQ